MPELAVPHRIASVILCVVALLLAGCATAPAARVASSPPTEVGIASYYHDDLHGRTTASGEAYDRNAWTAAHRTLPFGTRVRVRNQANGRTVELTINDRGPFVEGRILDVSRRAAEALEFVDEGLTEVTVEVLD